MNIASSTGPGFEPTEPGPLPHGFAPMQAQPAARSFNADNTASMKRIAVMLFIVGAPLLAIGVGTLRSGSGAGWMVLAGGAFLCAIAWIVLRQARDTRPVVAVAADGVFARQIKRTVPWNLIADAQLVRVQGQSFITLKLDREAAAATGLNKKALQFSLQALKPATQQAAFAAVGEGLLRSRAARGLAEPESVMQARQAAEQEAKLVAMTPITWGLYAVMALNVAVWLANVAAGLSAFRPAPADLYRWGANSTWAVMQQGEYWRLVTATVLHGGLMHLGLNMLGLWEAGRQVSRLYGNAQFLLIYWGSALAGSALSLHFSAQRSVSVGASGAVFGVLGAWLAAHWLHRRSMPGRFSGQSLGSLVVFVGYALVQGLVNPGIDNAAHMGGLLAGAGMAALLIDNAAEASARERRGSRMAVSVVVLASAVAGLAFAARGQGVNHEVVFSIQQQLGGLLPRLDAAQQAVAKDAREVRAGRMSESAFFDAVQARHLPAARAIDGEFRALDLQALGDAGTTLRDIARLSAVSTEWLELQLQVVRDPAAAPPASGQRLAALGQEMADLRARINEAGQAAQKAQKAR
ncbi:MAG: rhomboid family intramembrane serine protease [Burkholderiaceae bacterium]|nr:rhomboid family intramembrane serine protease [Burkholderiaceae bacterium]